jgi:hypothetical protein
VSQSRWADARKGHKKWKYGTLWTRLVNPMGNPLIIVLPRTAATTRMPKTANYLSIEEENALVSEL